MLLDFKIYGDLETPGSFCSDDLKAIRNPKWIKKLFNAFSKSQFDFNVYLYNVKDGIASFGRNL